MAYKHTSGEHLLSLKFHLVQSVIYFIEVFCRRASPFLFIFKALSTLRRRLFVHCTEEFLLSCSTLSESLLIIFVFSLPISFQKPLKFKKTFLFIVKAMINARGCSNNEIVKGWFCYGCSYLFSGVQVTLLVFLFDAQLFHPHEKETQKSSSSFSEV